MIHFVLDRVKHCGVRDKQRGLDKDQEHKQEVVDKRCVFSKNWWQKVWIVSIPWSGVNGMDEWMDGWWITWSIYMQEKLLVFCYRTIVGLVQHYLCCDVWRSASQIRADQKMFNFISHQWFTAWKDMNWNQELFIIVFVCFQSFTWVINNFFQHLLSLLLQMNNQSKNRFS